MGSIRRAGTALVFLAMGATSVAATGVAAQEDDAARQAYFGSVAEFFEISSSEISILGDWRLPADEIPVVLFVAGRAGVSAEALAALRRSGSSWAELAARYRISPGALHVPLPDAAPAGRLEGAYVQYRELPATRWSEVRLSDGDIVALVNVRLLSETLQLSVEEILRRAGSTGSFVELHARMVRDGQDRDGQG